MASKRCRLSSFVDIPEDEFCVDVDDEWIGMPELSQEDVGAVKSIKVNFESFEDMTAFALLLRQSITKKTKSIWYPKKDKECIADYVWHEEEQ